MGPGATPIGVTFRAGPFTPSGARIAHGLVVYFDPLGLFNDNAGHLEDADFPEDGAIIPFGHHSVNVAVVLDEYSSEVLSFDELSRAFDGDLCTCVEVMTIVFFGGLPSR
ncbi:hypothetical protein D1007_58875 [Hordeum vulgare]|nr:hypothetical protein D1007_58875 [Hordeum vulgare]